jgi:hypothetical protein
MKRFVGILAAVVMMLLLASPVLAASLGISPSHVELEVPGDGSAAANFKVYYFSGDLKVSLVDIPLKVEPETLRIEPSTEPVDIQLTIYGDESLGSQVYDGYIRFLGMSGETVAVAVKVKASVTNMVEGQPVPQKPSPEETPPPVPPPAPPAPPGLPPGPPPAPSGTTEWRIVPLAGIAAGTAIVITLVVVLARRRRY